MAKSRKDTNGRALYLHEFQRKDTKKYVYEYTDPLRRKRLIYADTLPELRAKENQLKKDQLDGLKNYVSDSVTINDVFDRYIKTKINLRQSTKNNYTYMYNHFVRDTFGKRKIKEVHFSDVTYYYISLIIEKELSINTVDNVHTVLHAVFELAHRDDIIRKNVADGAMREIKESYGKNKGVRSALSKRQMQVFLQYASENKIYEHWVTLFQFLFGTGCRIGEAAGITWDDIDFDNELINIRRQVIYRAGADGHFKFSVSSPKTQNSVRTIPMMSKVKEALLEERAIQEAIGGNSATVDGVSGFIFRNKDGNVIVYSNINRAIKRIVDEYNNKEEIRAIKEKREPEMLPIFTCHVLRHTFCTRLCEVEPNLKSIQGIMGHADISTTADIYAEATRDMVKKTIITLDNSAIF